MLDNIIGPQRPLDWLIQFWPVPVYAFVCALAATWLCKKIAIRFGIVDRPDDLVKTHKEPIAYLGGVGMLIGFMVGTTAGLFVCLDNPEYEKIFLWLAGIAAGAGISCAVGVVDDIFDISPKKKFLGQIVAAVALIAVGILPRLHYFTNPFGIDMPEIIEKILGISVVVFFVLGATNSLNLLDGLDGLCAGVTAVITIAMLLLSIHLATWSYSAAGDPVRIIVCLSLVGGCLGFLPFNRHPATIFMGDAGSMLLGFCIASMMILFAEEIPRWWMASIVIFGLPILDTATALARRFLNKRPLFVSDRGHIYDQMIDRGIPLKKTVGLNYLLAAVYALLGLLMSQFRTRYALVIYIVIFVVSAMIIWRKGFLKMEGHRGAVKKEE